MGLIIIGILIFFMVVAYLKALFDIVHNKYYTLNKGEEPIEPICDIQKAALNSLLTIDGVTYDNLLQGYLTSIGRPWCMQGIGNELKPGQYPSVKDELTYDQASALIKYGNELFRRR